jgi:hypothetical protein
VAASAATVGFGAPIGVRHAAMVVQRRGASAASRALPAAIGPSSAVATPATSAAEVSTRAAAPGPVSPAAISSDPPAASAHAHPEAAAMQERFLESLARTGAPRAAALPERFRPLARAISAKPIRIAHDSSARAALRAVNRPAATLGNVVHLQRAPDDSPESVELLAHELVHAAGTPSRPRFFAEPGDDHEEHRAHRVGQIARRATTQRVDPASLPLGRGAMVAPRVVQRTSAPSAVSAVAAVAASATASEVVQRTPSSSGGGATAARSASGSSRIIQRADSQSDASGSAPGRRTTSELLNEFDELIELIERRVINELERRGGRVRGNW